MIGKGGGITVTKTTGAADQGGSGSGNKGGCQCKEDCENVEKKVGVDRCCWCPQHRCSAQQYPAAPGCAGARVEAAKHTACRRQATHTQAAAPGPSNTNI
jgi:hypothetical protein